MAWAIGSGVKRVKLNIRSKLSLAFLMITLLLFGVISIFANFLLGKQFKEYAINKQEQKDADIVALLQSRYNDWGGKWDQGGLENIGVNTLTEGILLRIKDKDGTILWDARVHNNGMCNAILAHMASNMQNYNPDFQGGYVEKTYTIVQGNIQAGSVDIGYYGPYFYSDNDIQFLNTLNNLLLWAGVISSVAAIIIGIIFARQFAKPIDKVIAATHRIAAGDYGDRIAVKSDTREIKDLTNSINTLAETLSRQELLRKRLTSDVAHELRTPIATLQSHLEAMIDGVWEADEKRLGSCHEETIRLSKLVGDLEKLTKYEGENMVLNISRFEISALLFRIVTNFESEFKNKNVSLAFEYEQKKFIEADEDKLSQVFINLLSNALKYTPKDGKVAVKLATHENFVEVFVQDSGIGIDKEDQPYIFERFYRTDKSRTRLTGGIGIGLTIAKSIVEAHNGTINVESKLGEGSVFTVTLPATTGEETLN